MNFNIIAYLIYLPITSFITLWVGWTLYKNGRHFILKQMKGDEETTDVINRILLVGYYLINLGYCFWILSQWNSLSNLVEVIESVTETIGMIVLGLGFMHLTNIYILSVLGEKEQNINHYKP